MEIMKSVFGTVLALVAIIMAGLVVGGLLPAILFVVVIGAVAIIVNVVEARITGAAQQPLVTTAHAGFVTVLAVMAAWIAIGLFGPRDIAGVIFSLISAIVIVISGAILQSALKRDSHVSIVGS